AAYVQAPTALARSSAVVSLSPRAQRASSASSTAAIDQTTRNAGRPTAEWRGSSSSGSASPTRGPPVSVPARTGDSQPLAASSTPRPSADAPAIRAAATALCTQVPRRDEIGGRREPPPDRPLVPSLNDEVPVPHVQPLERAREARVLRAEAIGRARVHPD